VITHVLTLYALYLFLVGSWAQTEIGLHNYSTVLRFPNAFIASAGLVCAASMMLIVGSNLLKIAINHPDAVMAGDPPKVAELPDVSVSAAHNPGAAP